MEDKYVLDWKMYNGNKITNVSDYVREWALANPFGDIIIGCDSQAHHKYVKYSISICMHMKDEFDIGHGAHVIFANVFATDKSLKRDLHRKLLLEATLSIQAADEAKQNLENCGMKIVVHLDYNSKEEEFSNSLYNSGIGMVNGMGYKAYGKPYAWAASHTSDALCKNKQAKGVGPYRKK